MCLSSHSILQHIIQSHHYDLLMINFQFSYPNHFQLIPKVLHYYSLILINRHKNQKVISLILSIIIEFHNLNEYYYLNDYHLNDYYLYDYYLYDYDYDYYYYYYYYYY